GGIARQAQGQGVDRARVARANGFEGLAAAPSGAPDQARLFGDIHAGRLFHANGTRWGCQWSHPLQLLLPDFAQERDAVPDDVPNVNRNATIAGWPVKE